MGGEFTTGEAKFFYRGGGSTFRSQVAYWISIFYRRGRGGFAEYAEVFTKQGVEGRGGLTFRSQVVQSLIAYR
jgi:hypothetical protein